MSYEDIFLECFTKNPIWKFSSGEIIIYANREKNGNGKIMVIKNNENPSELFWEEQSTNGLDYYYSLLKELNQRNFHQESFNILIISTIPIPKDPILSNQNLQKIKNGILIISIISEEKLDDSFELKNSQNN